MFEKVLLSKNFSIKPASSLTPSEKEPLYLSEDNQFLLLSRQRLQKFNEVKKRLVNGKGHDHISPSNSDLLRKKRIFSANQRKSCLISARSMPKFLPKESPAHLMQPTQMDNKSLRISKSPLARRDDRSLESKRLPMAALRMIKTPTSLQTLQRQSCIPSSFAPPAVLSGDRSPMASPTVQQTNDDDLK